MISAIFNAALFSILRARHGAGQLKRWLTYAFMTFGIILAHGYYSHVFALSMLLCIALGLGPGWGKYFSIVSGAYNPKEKEFFIADTLLDWWGEHFPRLAGTLGMSIRWVVCFMPLFFILGRLEYALVLSLVGPIYLLSYFFKRDESSIRLAEYISGALLGFLIAV